MLNACIRFGIGRGDSSTVIVFGCTLLGSTRNMYIWMRVSGRQHPVLYIQRLSLASIDVSRHTEWPRIFMPTEGSKLPPIVHFQISN